ncbi:hypothetical protein TorRG33x02_315550 [Trema orientale]|uniref:Uncharacterized protein n=1 Tax=Trema orientale TaxID=63057 RepID=A0A2P5BMV0_TREOI|nr:hypothetical protein TorRG33x02_315550 [Trema orientale]
MSGQLPRDERLILIAFQLMREWAIRQAEVIDNEIVAQAITIKGLNHQDKEVGSLLTNINFEYTAWYPLKSAPPLKTSEFPLAPPNKTPLSSYPNKRSLNSPSHLDKSPAQRMKLFLKGSMDRMHVACSDQLVEDGRRCSDRDFTALYLEYLSTFMNELMYECMRDLLATAKRYRSKRNTAREEWEQQLKRTNDVENQLGKEKKAKLELERQVGSLKSQLEIIQITVSDEVKKAIIKD